MSLRVLFLLCAYALSSAAPCKGECAKKCSSDKQESSGTSDCPDTAAKCCLPRPVSNRPALLTKTNLSYFAISVCAVIGVLWFCRLIYVHFTSEKKPNLYKYVWPHEAGAGPLPFKDLKFDEQSQLVNQDDQGLTTYHSPHRFRAGNALLDPSRPRAALLFVPPLGSHMQRYTLLPSIASGLGFATFGLDHLGFGQSGATGVVSDFENLVRDVLDFAGRIKERHPDVLLFISGHGLGATIATLCIHQDPHMFAGVVYVAPIFNPFWTKFQQGLIRKLGGRFPNLRLRNVCWPAPDITSPNKAMEEWNLQDPLYFKGPMPLGTALQLLKLMEAACECVPETTTNLLLQQGGRDLVSFGAAKHLAKSKAVIKDHFVTKDAWHDLLGSYQSPEIVSNMLDWVQDRVQAVFLASTLD